MGAVGPDRFGATAGTPAGTAVCPIPIETDRLVVRRFLDQDLDDFLEYDTHPDFDRFRSGDAHSRAEAAKFIADHQKLDLGLEGEWLSLAVELKSERRMIGHVCLKVVNARHRQGDVGWFLNPRYQGCGYATEASRALLDLGFRSLDLHRITARCDVENTRSRLMMERLGMRREALSREVAYFKGEWHDQYTYAILVREWEERVGVEHGPG